MKKIAFLLCLSFGFAALAQMASPPPAAAPAVSSASALVSSVSGNPVLAWINAHGGFQASVYLLVFSAMTALSAIRVILTKFDGVDPGASGPSPDKKLNVINLLCLYGGELLDLLMGNVQH
jgi:hypothetical protein